MGIIRSLSINRTLFGRYYINLHARGAVVRKKGYVTTKHGLIANNNRKGGLYDRINEMQKFFRNSQVISCAEAEMIYH